MIKRVVCQIKQLVRDFFSGDPECFGGSKGRWRGGGDGGEKAVCNGGSDETGGGGV